MSERLQQAARRIFADALQQVDVVAAVRRRILLDETHLRLADATIGRHELDRVVLIAMGKAAVPMYRAAAEALYGLELTGVVVAPAETLPTTLPGTQPLRGDHPMPTQSSLQAADVILQALAIVTPRTAVLFLVSGGASAMVEQPLAPAVSLDELREFSQALVGSGLGITAMNTLRKHLSAVKGGRLAVAAGAAALQCTLLISDVPLASPDAIGSGPSLPDTTTVAECRALLQPVNAPALPANVLRWFQSPLLPETPKLGHPAFSRAHWEVVLSGEHLVQAAEHAAQAHGFYPATDNSCDDWEYRAAARHLLDQAHAIARRERRPTCLVSVGELSVSLNGTPGEGGRNQQFALWCAQALTTTGRSATVLSAGTDGVDGNSTAAGAVCDETTVARATAVGYTSAESLLHFNTSPLLHAVGDTVWTGPTGNNLRDVRLILVEP